MVYVLYLLSGSTWKLIWGRNLLEPIFPVSKVTGVKFRVLALFVATSIGVVWDPGIDSMFVEAYYTTMVSTIKELVIRVQ